MFHSFLAMHKNENEKKLYIFLHSPLSHSSDNDSSAIFVFVMSLWDAKNKTTSRFSFLMGTISSKHQKGVPRIIKKYKKMRKKI